MGIPYEKIVAEDLNTGYGTTAVTMPGGGSATGRKVGTHTLVSTLFNLRDLAVGDGVADDSGALTTLAAAIVAAGGGDLLVPAGTYRLRSSVTLASSVRLHMLMNARFSIDSGVVLTINGALTTYGNAFTGAGTVRAIGIIDKQFALERVGAITSTAVVAGGTLTAATYFMRLFPLDEFGAEGPPSRFETSQVISAGDVSAGNRSITVTWTPAASARGGYRLYVGTSGAATYDQYYTIAAEATSYTITAKMSPVTGLATVVVTPVASDLQTDNYYFKVSAINASGETVQFDTSLFVQLTAAQNKNARIDLSWNAVSGATGYRVNISNDSTGGPRGQLGYVEVGAVATFSYTGQALTTRFFYGNLDHQATSEVVAGSFRATAMTQRSIFGPILIAPGVEAEPVVILDRKDPTTGLSGIYLRQNTSNYWSFGLTSSDPDYLAFRSVTGGVVEMLQIDRTNARVKVQSVTNGAADGSFHVAQTTALNPSTEQIVQEIRSNINGAAASGAGGRVAFINGEGVDRYLGYIGAHRASASDDGVLEFGTTSGGGAGVGNLTARWRIDASGRLYPVAGGENLGLSTNQVALAASGVTMQSDAAFTRNPIFTVCGFWPGTLTAGTVWLTWTPERPVIIDRVQVQVLTAPVGCGTNAVVRVNVGGGSLIDVTIAAAANDSGAAQNLAVAAGAVVTVFLAVAAAGCGTTPANANVIISYRMQ